MKTFTKYLLLPLCCLFMAAGCGKDDLPTGGQPEGPGSETGILSFENWDLTVADDMEILPTDNAPGTSSTRSTVDAPDDYIVKIYNSKKEQVGSYTYAEIKTTGNIELPQDSYTVTAESPNYASIPDVAWETPVYYGEVSVNVIKKLTTTVNNLVCKLGNIKTTVGLSADLDNLFKPDDETDKLTVTLSIQDNSLVYGRVEGTGKARIATPGLTDLAVYDLWLNTADFQVIVTDPALTNVKVRYRERERLAESPAFGEWKTVTAVAGADYTYTAQAIDFAADRDYEYQLLINDAETGEIHNFSAATGIQLPNAGFETWTNSKTWYPCSADEIGSNGMGTGYTGFWGTGNPGANAAGIVVTEPADDPRPGSTGSKSALLKTQSAFGVIAAGNLFIGAFGGVHNITKGDVYMGRPFTFNARPKAITFWYKGTVGSGDKARFFVCMGKWSSYHKIDTNDQSTFFDPSQESLPEGPIYGHGDWLNDTSQSDWKKIVIPIKYRSDEKPNYLMVTASASYRGDYMEGNKESRMYIDDIEFVY